MSIFQHTTVLRSFTAVFEDIPINVEVWRVHEGYRRDYYYAVTITDPEQALRLQPEECVREGLPIFFRRVAMGVRVIWFGGAGYLDHGLPGRLGPLLDEVSGQPLPLADIDNPFVNPEGEQLDTLSYRTGGWWVARRRGVYSNAIYYRVADSAGRSMVIVRCPPLSPEKECYWAPDSNGPGTLDRVEAAGKAIDRYERRRGLIVPPSYETLVPQDLDYPMDDAAAFRSNITRYPLIELNNKWLPRSPNSP